MRKWLHPGPVVSVQGVSGLNSDRKGALRDARSSLFPHVRRVFGMCRRKFTWAQVHYMMESVASMDAKDWELMSQDIGVLPWKIDSAGIALCHRPRLYWISWDLEPGEGVVIHPPKGDAWDAFGTIELTAKVDATQFLHTQAALHSDGRLPTFTTSRPRAHPGNRPAGLWQCEDHEGQRWVDDEYRYPPYQYRDKNLVWSPQGPRLPTIAEKEVIMGFPLHFTSPALPKSRQAGVGYLDVRHSLIGNSWNVQVVTWLLSNLFGRLGLTSVTSVAQVVSHTSPGRDDSLRAYLQRLPLTPLRGSQAVNMRPFWPTSFQVLFQSRVRTFFYKLPVSNWCGFRGFELVSLLVCGVGVWLQDGVGNFEKLISMNSSFVQC